jgi:phosphate transport system substrate-binding protein
MKKRIARIIVVAMAFVGLALSAGCTKEEKDILVVAREAGSGTREAFDGMIKNTAGDSLMKTAGGISRDALVETADIQNTTNNVMMKVAGNKNAIGYISLGSLNDTVKAVKVAGIAASPATVLDGSYTLQRPFVILVRKNAALTPAAADFLKYLQSSSAQDIVGAKLVKQENASQSAYIAPAEPISGAVVIKGSTSVDPCMDLLIADYQKKGGSNVIGITFNKDAQGSAAGITAVKGDTAGNIIGMSSGAVKSADASALDYFSIALDAIAVIVNKDNTLEDITIDQLYKIYSGEIKKFSELA